MRGCYYVSKRGIRLSKYLYVLPNLALPIGLQPHTNVPLADNNGQTAASNNQEGKGSTLKLYNANQSRNASLQGTTYPSTSNPSAITETSQAHEEVGSGQKSIVDDDWLSDGILRYYHSTEEDFPFLLHLCNDQPECDKSGDKLADDAIQEYETLLAMSEPLEDAKCVSPSFPTGGTPKKAQGSPSPQASQSARGKIHPEENVQSTFSPANETTRRSKPPVIDSVGFKDVEAERSSTSGPSASDQTRQQPAKLDFSAPQLSNPCLEDLQEQVHPLAEQPCALRGRVYMNRAESNALSSTVSSSYDLSVGKDARRENAYDDVFLTSTTLSGVLHDVSETHSVSQGSELNFSRLRRTGDGGSQKDLVKIAATEDLELSVSSLGDDHMNSVAGLAGIQGGSELPKHRAQPRKRKATFAWCETELRDTKRAGTTSNHNDVPSPSVTPEAVAHHAGRDAFDTNSSLLLLRTVAEELYSKAKIKGGLDHVLKQSTQADFITRMQALAEVSHTSRASLVKYMSSDRWWPIISRVGRWLKMLGDIQRPEGMDTNSFKRSADRNELTLLKSPTGGRRRRVHLDMTYGFIFHLLLEKREIGESFRKTIFASGSQEADSLHEAWKGFNRKLSTRLGIEEGIAQTDLEAILFYALLFTIVSENIDVKVKQLCPKMLGSEEFAEAIVGYAQEFLSGRRGLKMSADQLNNLKEKCKWITFLPSDSDEPLVRDEDELTGHKSQFYLERIARCFKSIFTLSTTITKRGWAAQKIREIILSRTLVRKEELQAELKPILALFRAIEPCRYWSWAQLDAWEKDILVIMKRSQAWMEVLTAEGAANMKLWFRRAYRNKVRDFVDVLGFFLHTLNIFDGATLESLRSKTVELLLACRGSQIRINDESTGFDALVQPFSASRIAQELLLCSTLHYLLAANVHFAGEDYFDYSVLTEEDVTAICNQAKKYLANVRSPTIDSNERDIRLPECERSRIIKRLRG